MGKKEDALKIEALKEVISKKVAEAKGQIKTNYENSMSDLKDSLKEADALLSPESFNLQGYEAYPLAVVELANVLLNLKMRKRQQEMQAAQYFKQAMQQGCKGCGPESCQRAPK